MASKSETAAKGRVGRPPAPTVRSSHTISFDPDLRQSVQNYFDGIKRPGLTVPDAIRELLMLGLGQEPLEAVSSSVRWRMYRAADELLIRRALDFIHGVEKELKVYLRQAVESGALVNDPTDVEEPHEG